MFDVSNNFPTMNAKLSSLKSHFTNWRNWEMNPIVIKELRQGVRSWTVTGMLMLFLVVLFIASLGLLMTDSVELANVAVVENLTGLGQLPPAGALFTAVPLPVQGLGTIPVRAFARLGETR